MRFYLLLILVLTFSCKKENVTPEPVPALIDITNDLTYSNASISANSDHQLDIYSPKNGDNWPVLILLHGGLGSRKAADFVEMSTRLANENIVVFNTSYPMSLLESVTMNDGETVRAIMESIHCAIGFAKEHAQEYKGDPNRLNILGHSAGGVFGCLAAFLGEQIVSNWENFESERGNPPQQFSCIANQVVEPINGFVGFNGSYFALEITGLPQQDSMLWELVNLRNYVGDNPSLKVRFIYGSLDNTQPAEHVDLSSQFIEELKVQGYNAEQATINAGHDFSFEGEAWTTTLSVIKEIMN